MGCKNGGMRYIDAASARGGVGMRRWSGRLEKSLDIRREAEEFWRDLRTWCEGVRAHAYGELDYGVLGRLQAIDVAWPGKRTDALSSLPQLIEVVSHLQALSPCDVLGESLLERGMRLSRLGSFSDDFSRESLSERRFDALSERLYGMHRFLEGESGGEDFGRTTRLERGDFAYGLGVRLLNGRLHELFMRLKRVAGGNSESYFRKFFDEETEPLLLALESDSSQFTAYMQSHMILRYDGVFSRSVYELSPSMQQYLGRLGADATARREQIGVVSGERFSGARRDATDAGVRSLRGFAMLFDLGNRVSEQTLERMSGSLCESEKCLSLADSVISRLHGMQAHHWQTRLESVYRGHGMVGERYYEESRFFGTDAGNLGWEDADWGMTFEGVTQRPRAGHYYVVCRGDRLRQLIAEAYGTSRDYRIVLRQNPHIVQPERLTPGMKIFFPELGEGVEKRDGGSWHVVNAGLGMDSASQGRGGLGAWSVEGGEARGSGDMYDSGNARANEAGHVVAASGEAKEDDDRRDGASGDGEDSTDVADNLRDGDIRRAKASSREEGKSARRMASGEGIELLGEVIGDLSCLRSEQLDDLCDKLNGLSESQYVRTVCVDQDDSVCLVCDHVVLFVSEDDDIERFMRTTFSTPSFLASKEQVFRRARDAFRAWGRSLAAQIRGDVVLSADCCLPLARFPEQRNRRAWVTTALRRLREEAAEGVRFVIHGRERRVDLVDRYGVCVVRLQSEDFRAMRMQPWRRYADYYAPPIVQMNALMQVWLGDLYGVPVEIGVPPLSCANQYSIRQEGGIATFRVPMGTPVYPIMRGRVVSVGNDAENGKYVVIEHHDGLFSRYMSLSTSFVAAGMQVEAETTIGRSGCMGNDIDPKLCLEIVASDGKGDGELQTDDEGSGENRRRSCEELRGRRLDYFDVVCNVWPSISRFDWVIDKE